MVMTADVGHDKTPFMVNMLKSMVPFPAAWDDYATTCAICDGSATEFNTELSKKEYRISKMCQGCQDKAFGTRR